MPDPPPSLGRYILSSLFSNLLIIPAIILSLYLLLVGWDTWRTFHDWIRSPTTGPLLLWGGVSFVAILGLIKIRREWSRRTR